MTRESMKTMRIWILILSLLAALPVFAAAQQASPPPLQILLQNREALRLRPEQVTQLESIRASLQMQNEPLIARIVEQRQQFQREQRAARAGAGRQGQEGRPLPMRSGQARTGGQQAQAGQRDPAAQQALLEQIRLAAQPIKEQIDANNHAAMRQVQRILTPRQRARLRELVEARRPPAGRGAPGVAGEGAVQPGPPVGLEK